MYRPDHVSHAFERWRDRLGLPHLHLHSLRHFSATQLAAAGVGVRTIADRLGHDPTMTLRVYAHRDEVADRSAADVLGPLLLPSKAGEEAS
jgi:integrase